MIIACPHCATIQTMPAPPERGRLLCRRCSEVLERTTGRSLDRALACALTTLLLLFPANTLTLLTVHAPAGLAATTHLFSGCVTIWQQGWPLLAVVLALQGVVIPFVRFGLLALTLTALRFGSQAYWIGPTFRWSERLDAWAMADVFLLGAAIGYGRVVALIPVQIDGGGYALIAAAMMTMITRATLDRRAVWRQIEAPAHHATADAIGCTECDLVVPGRMVGGRCPRCAARLHRRYRSSTRRATALTIAAWALLPIANYFPMSTLYRYGEAYPHTILAGIQLLFQNGYAPLGVAVFLTSIGFPFVKLLGLTWFLISVHQHSVRRLRFKTKFYRFIDEIGRWSNLDPFTLVIFTPMVQFGQLAEIRVGGGAPAFLAMIVLSMFAAYAFDPRLMWDSAEARPAAALIDPALAPSRPA